MNNLPPSEDDWRQKAACVGEDPEQFFPQGDGYSQKSQKAQIIAAKEICGRCIVKDTCLEWALETGVMGVWGGMTTQERTRINARQRFFRQTNLRNFE